MSPILNYITAISVTRRLITVNTEKSNMMEGCYMQKSNCQHICYAPIITVKFQEVAALNAYNMELWIM